MQKWQQWYNCNCTCFHFTIVDSKDVDLKNATFVHSVASSRLSDRGVLLLESAVRAADAGETDSSNDVLMKKIKQLERQNAELEKKLKG
jgi:hypothetical protein